MGTLLMQKIGEKEFPNYFEDDEMAKEVLKTRGKKYRKATKAETDAFDEDHIKRNAGTFDVPPAEGKAVKEKPAKPKAEKKAEVEKPTVEQDAKGEPDKAGETDPNAKTEAKSKFTLEDLQKLPQPKLREIAKKMGVSGAGKNDVVAKRIYDKALENAAKAE